MSPNSDDYDISADDALYPTFLPGRASRPVQITITPDGSPPYAVGVDGARKVGGEIGVLVAEHRDGRTIYRKATAEERRAALRGG